MGALTVIYTLTDFCITFCSIDFLRLKTKSRIKLSAKLLSDCLMEVNLMDDHRIHSRMKLHLHCHLDHGGNTYYGLLEEISLGGALVKVDDYTPLKIGDLCELVLCKKSVLFHLKRTGKIVRLDSERTMAVSFLNHISIKEALSIHLNLTSHPSAANKISLG